MMFPIFPQVSVLSGDLFLSTWKSLPPPLLPPHRQLTLTPSEGRVVVCSRNMLQSLPVSHCVLILFFFYFNKYCYGAQLFCEASCGTHPVSEVQKCREMQKNEGEMVGKCRKMQWCRKCQLWCHRRDQGSLESCRLDRRIAYSAQL